MTNEYEDQAKKFLDDTSTTLSVEYIDESCPPFCDGGKHIHGDHFKFTLARDGGREYKSDYWNSYAAALKDERKKAIAFGDSHHTIMRLKRKARAIIPTAYDILACLSATDLEILLGDLQPFMDEYGFDNADRALACRELLRTETMGLHRLYADTELEHLAEIS